MDSDWTPSHIPGYAMAMRSRGPLNQGQATRIDPAKSGPKQVSGMHLFPRERTVVFNAHRK
eukprot:10620548-Lingulodinium_polyedra.AAC.1